MWNLFKSTLMQIFAVGVIGVTVGALIAAGIGAPKSAPVEGPRKFFKRIAAWLRPHAGGLAIAVAVLAAFMFWTQAWGFWVARSTERSGYASLTVEQAAYSDARLGNANMPFLEFVRGNLGAGQSYALAPAKSRDDVFVRQWSSYVMIPHLLADEQDADLLVIFNADPKSVKYDRKRFPELQEFAPGYAIARRGE